MSIGSTSVYAQFASEYLELLRVYQNAVGRWTGVDSFYAIEMARHWINIQGFTGKENAELLARKHGNAADLYRLLYEDGIKKAAEIVDAANRAEQHARVGMDFIAQGKLNLGVGALRQAVALQDFTWPHGMWPIWSTVYKQATVLRAKTTVFRNAAKTEKFGARACLSCDDGKRIIHGDRLDECPDCRGTQQLPIDGSTWVPKAIVPQQTAPYPPGFTPRDHLPV